MTEAGFVPYPHLHPSLYLSQIVMEAQARDSLLTSAEAYIRRYTRRKGETLPTTPVSCTSEDIQAMHGLVKRLNELSGESMQARNYDPAWTLLEKAEKLAFVLKKKAESLEGLATDQLRVIGRAQSLTFNNIGYYYMLRQKFVSALEYMEKTLRVEQSAKLPARDLGTTCSNVTAVLSKLGRHEEAREYAERAVSLLEKADEAAGDNPDLGLALATAYFNFSVECEYLSRLDQAQSLLQQALEIAQRRLAPSHPLTRQIQGRLQPRSQSFASPKSVASEEFSNASVSEDQQSELRVMHQGYRQLAGVTHKIIIYGRSGGSSLRCVAFTRSKEKILKLNVPAGMPPEEVLDQLSVQQGRLVLGPRSAENPRKLFTVSARVNEATYSAVIRADSSKTVSWSEATPAPSDSER